MTIRFELTSILIDELVLDQGTPVSELSRILKTLPDVHTTTPPAERYFAHFHERGLTALVARADDSLRQLYVKLKNVTLPFLPECVYSGFFQVNLGALTENETRVGLRHLQCLQFKDSGAGFVCFPSENYSILLAGDGAEIDYLSISWDAALLKKLLSE